MTARTPITGFNESEHRAIERFLTARTVPLAYEGDEGPTVRGTGSFYRTGNDLFLVTAAHVFDGIDPSRLGVPDRPSGNVSIWNLDDIRVYHPKDTDNFDVAVVRFLNPNFIARVASSWESVHESEVIVDTTAIAEFLIAGYPAVTVASKNGTLTPAPMLQLFTKRFEGKADPPTADFELLLRYGRKARALFGDELSTPALGGVSGALVYAKCKINSSVWSPEAVLRPVGVQVSMKHDQYVRVKSWVLIHRLIELIREKGI